MFNGNCHHEEDKSINGYNKYQVIEDIIKLDSSFIAIYETQIRHYTLMEHTKLVLSEFDKYFNLMEWNLPIRKESFRTFLAIHDIGKPKAFKEGNKSKQHQYSCEIFKSIQDKLDLTDKEKGLSFAMLSIDPIGKYFQNLYSAETAKKEIVDKAGELRIEAEDMLRLITIYYQADAGSYTKDAGGFRYLEHIFEYKNGIKVFDSKNLRLFFTTIYEQKYNLLQNLIKA